MSHHRSSLHSIAGAATTTPVRGSCRAAAKASAAAATPKRRSSRAAAAAANRAMMREPPIELCTDELGDINDEDINRNSRNDNGSDYNINNSSGNSSGSNSEEEVSYTDSLRKGHAADAGMADVTSPQHTPLQQCKRPGSSIDRLACKKAKQAVHSRTKASSAAAPQSPADSPSARENTARLENVLSATAPDGATDSQVDARPCAEPQAQHRSQQAPPTSAAPTLAPPPPPPSPPPAAAAAAGGSGSEARIASVQIEAAINGVTAGAVGLQPPPATGTAAATQPEGTDVLDAAGEAEDEIADDGHTTATADELEGEAASELGSDWTEAPASTMALGRKLNLNHTDAGSPTGRTIHIPRFLMRQMTGQHSAPRRLKLRTTLFKDGYQLGPILECTLNQPGKILLTTNTVKSILGCTITKLRAKKPNFFEVYVVTDTSQPPASLTSGAPAPAAATPSGNAGQPASICSEQAPAAFGPTQTRQQEAATEAAAATAPILRHAESGGHVPSPHTMPQSDPMQDVAPAAAAADAAAVLSQETAAAHHYPMQLASTSTVAAAPVSMGSAAPEGAQLPADYNMAPYKTVPQAVMELIPLLGFMKAPKAVRCQFRSVFAALKQLQEGNHEVEMFKADYMMLAWLVELKDVEEVWSALGELLKTVTVRL